MLSVMVINSSNLPCQTADGVEWKCCVGRRQRTRHHNYRYTVVLSELQQSESGLFHTTIIDLLQVSDEFEKQWEGGNFPGWPKETSGALAHTGAYLDLSAFSSAEELASLGLDRLKSALMALNLKCGG